MLMSSLLRPSLPGRKTKRGFSWVTIREQPGLVLRYGNANATT